MHIASAVALISVLGAPARATEPLQPAGKWNVDFGDAHCVAMNQYRATLSVDQSAPVAISLRRLTMALPKQTQAGGTASVGQRTL